jgi:hypothetical protein
MRIICESPRTPATATIPSDADSPLAGTIVDGVIWFCVRTVDQGEAIPKHHDHARPVSQVLKLLGPGQVHRSAVPAVFASRTGPLNDAVVPRDLLDALAPNTVVALDWEFDPLPANA